jgi:hypothetical protein
LINDNAIDEVLGDNDNDASVSRFYLTKVFNEFTQLKNTLIQMLHIQEFCKIKGIKLINFATVFDASHLNQKKITHIASSAFMSRKNKDIKAKGIEFNTNLLLGLIGKLDSSCWINNELFSSMNTILKDYPRLPDRHIGVEGSNKWAEIILKHL